MSGCHAIPTRLEDRGLYVGLLGQAGVYSMRSETDAAVSMKVV
jgi:hypothetical protein